MRLTNKVFTQIKDTIGVMKPEQGGLLLSNDGGRTINKFIFDTNGEKSSVTYSPNVNFLNEQILKHNKEGYYFIGIVHSHPMGFSQPSMGRGFNKNCKNNYTVSDEECFYKLLDGMKGTNKLYFPIVQSEYGGGTFSMRIFYAMKTPNGRYVIDEEPLEIVNEEKTMARDYDNVNDLLRFKDYLGKTAILVGLNKANSCAEKLAQSGISSFILVDGEKLSPEDKEDSAIYSEIGTYKADATARRIFAINPFAKVKILRFALTSKTNEEKFREITKDIDYANSVICLCSEDNDVRKTTKYYAKKFKINIVDIVVGENTIESYILKPQKHHSFRVKTYYINNTQNNEIYLDTLNVARKDAILFALNGGKFDQEQAEPFYSKPLKTNKWASLYDEDVIKTKTVVVVGCGGSRSYIENLARSGIQRFILIDGDKYSISNTQTQMAYYGDLGHNKAEIIANQVKEINPKAEVIVKSRMLDEKVSDELFAKWVGAVIKEKPEDVLIAACTDSFHANARCSRLALKYGCPFLQAGIYTGGRILEIIFFHPQFSKVCPRCMLEKRYNANLNTMQLPKPAESDGTSVFFTEELNAKKGYISLSLLLYNTNSDPRYSNFLIDNRWVSRNGKQAVDRNFMFYTLDSHMEKNAGIHAYKLFDKWGLRLGSKYQVGVSYFMKKKPRKGCPDCGGKGNLLRVKGKIKDTREGIYY